MEKRSTIQILAVALLVSSFVVACAKKDDDQPQALPAALNAGLNPFSTGSGAGITFNGTTGTLYKYELKDDVTQSGTSYNPVYYQRSTGLRVALSLEEMCENLQMDEQNDSTATQKRKSLFIQQCSTTAQGLWNPETTRTNFYADASVSRFACRLQTQTSTSANTGYPSSLQQSSRRPVLVMMSQDGTNPNNAYYLVARQTTNGSIRHLELGLFDYLGNNVRSAAVDVPVGAVNPVTLGYTSQISVNVPERGWAANCNFL